MDMKGFMFHGLVIYIDRSPTALQRDYNHPLSESDGPTDSLLRNIIGFAGGRILSSMTDKEHEKITHIVATSGSDVSNLRKLVSRWKGKIPRIVSAQWVQECWDEGTRVDEEGYAVR
jgi:DNA ligase-4